MKLNTLSDLNGAIRLREIMAQIDSGNSFWVWDDSISSSGLEAPNRKMRCFVGVYEIGTVSIWYSVPHTGFEGMVLAYAWQRHAPAMSKQFDGDYEDQVIAAKAWVIARYNERE